MFRLGLKFELKNKRNFRSNWNLIWLHRTDEVEFMKVTEQLKGKRNKRRPDFCILIMGFIDHLVLCCRMKQKSTGAYHLSVNYQTHSQIKVLFLGGTGTQNFVLRGVPLSLKTAFQRFLRKLPFLSDFLQLDFDKTKLWEVSSKHLRIFFNTKSFHNTRLRILVVFWQFLKGTISQLNWSPLRPHPTWFQII